MSTVEELRKQIEELEKKLKFKDLSPAEQAQGSLDLGTRYFNLGLQIALERVRKEAEERIKSRELFMQAVLLKAWEEAWMLAKSIGEREGSIAYRFACNMFAQALASSLTLATSTYSDDGVFVADIPRPKGLDYEATLDTLFEVIEPSNLALSNQKVEMTEHSIIISGNYTGNGDQVGGYVHLTSPSGMPNIELQVGPYYVNQDRK